MPVKKWISRSLVLCLGLIFFIHFFVEDNSRYRGLQQNEHLHHLLKLQRQIDRYAAISESHIQGTHNSYNSDAYHHLLRYHDRQQRLTLFEQLHSGARFLELDVHWTFSAHTLTQDLLLCHGSSKFNWFGFHWGCSPFDLPLQDALEEVSSWIVQNPEEVLILYIEDHSDGEHEYLYQLLQQTGVSERIYASGGCRAIPDDLSKHDVLSAGKQIVFWKDELRQGFDKLACAEHQGIAQLAFNDLGNLKRTAEDRTAIGSLLKFLIEGEWPKITEQDVRSHLLKGSNILNFDNFIQNDERLYQYLWSWHVETQFNEAAGCAVLQLEDGWNLDSCDTQRPVACFNSQQNSWKVLQAANFEAAQQACEEVEHGHLVFSAPTNINENTQLLLAMREASVRSVGLNLRYDFESMQIEPGDKRKHNEGHEKSLHNNEVENEF